MSYLGTAWSDRQLAPFLKTWGVEQRRYSAAALRQFLKFAPASLRSPAAKKLQELARPGLWLSSPNLDHIEVFTREQQTVFLVAHPYQIHGFDETLSLFRNAGFSVDVSEPGESWYDPESWLVTICHPSVREWPMDEEHWTVLENLSPVDEILDWQLRQQVATKYQNASIYA